jgi:dihydroorotase
LTNQNFAQKYRLVSILNYVGIDKNTTPIGKPGEHMYKLYFGKSIGDLTVTYGSELDVILSRYKKHHVSFHVEYEPIVQAHAGGKTHTDRRPASAVNEGLRLLLPLIEKYDIKAKLCHWSTGGESFEMIRTYQKRGCNIVLEVSPLHLVFDEEQTKADPSLWLKIQMNPAVQASTHRKALIEGLKKGFIQFLATDHAPHTLDEKYMAFAQFKDAYPESSLEEIAQQIRTKDKALFEETCTQNNTSGAPWLDVYGFVCTWLMQQHQFTPQDIARVAAYYPGQFVNSHLKKQFPKKNFGKGFGEIKKGFVGSFTVLNTKTLTTVTRDMLQTKVGWSPLEGMTMSGAIEAVFIEGKKVK